MREYFSSNGHESEKSVGFNDCLQAQCLQCEKKGHIQEDRNGSLGDSEVLLESAFRRDMAELRAENQHTRADNQRLREELQATQRQLNDRTQPVNNVQGALQLGELP